MTSIADMKYQRTELLAKSQRIIDTAKAAGRDLNTSEVGQVEKNNEAIDALDRQIDGKKLVDSVASLDGGYSAVDGRKGLSLFGHRAKANAATVAARLGGGAKSLVDSATVTFHPEPVSLDLGVQAIPRPPLTFLEVLPSVAREAVQYAYLRQSVRTNNAAVVAQGDVKPTSIYTAAPEQGRLSVFAHMSEPVDEYLLLDNNALSMFISSEMFYGLQLAVEDQVLNGDGAGDNLTGLLNTSGVQTQAFDTDPLTTLRSAATRLEVLGYTAGAYLLNPVDWQRIETHRNATGSFDLGGPVDRAARTVWGVRVALSTRLDEGQAIALDTSVASIDTDQAGVQFKLGAIGDEFARNQMRARCEGRFGLSVYQPNGIVLTDLAADESDG